MKFFLIVNPISGDNDKTALIEQVTSALKEGDEITKFETTGEQDTEQIRQRLTTDSFDRVIVMGGDGTVKLAAEAMGDRSLPIGVIPAGSANGLATDLCLPEDPEEFIPVALYGNTKKMDAISINGQLCLHISDFGMNAELIREYEDSSMRGKLGYAINSVSALLKNDGPYEFKIETDDETFTEEGIMLAIANSKQFGTGSVINPQGKIDDGIFEVLVFKKIDLFEIFKTFNDNVEELSEEFVVSISAKKVKVTTKDNVPFQIDGEYCDALNTVEAHILPGKLEIAVPT